MSVADTVHVGHNPALISADTEPMLSISQFTEKFLEQNLSKFLYHIEVIVRCRRRSGLSFLFTHFIVFTSFPPCSPLTISLSSLFTRYSNLVSSLSYSLVHFFLLLPFFLFALVFPFFSFSFFLLFSLLPLISPSLTPCFLFLHSPSAPPPFAIPHPAPPPPSWSCISAYNKSRFVYPRYFENV